METKVMQVYYDSSAYPFKDQAREVRYPVIGTTFTGASNTTRIRFYVNQFANICTCTFVAITKLPSGKKLYEQLSKDTTSDTEPFVYLDISSAYTQEKGDIQIALNVYEGGVNIVVDSDSGLYSVSGSPIITATGNIKISVAYTPYMDSNYGNVPTISVQQALALVSGKIDETSAIVVVDDTDNISASVFTNGQMVYDKSTDIFYQVVSGSYAKQTLVDITYEYLQSGNDIILTIKLSDGTGVYKTLNINLTTYLASLTYVNAQLDLKADKSTTYTKTETDSLLSDKVDKTTNANKVYATDNSGNQTTLSVDYGTTFSGNVVRRDSNSQVYVPLTPTANGQATSKVYVDVLVGGVAHTIGVSVNNTTFVQTFTLYNANGQAISSATCDLPIESMVISGTYDSDTEEIVLTLQSGETIEIPVSDLVDGLVSTDDLATTLANYYTKSQTDTLLSAKVDKTTTIAGIDMQDNITAQTLTDSLVFMNNTTDIDYVMGD